MPTEKDIRGLFRIFGDPWSPRRLTADPDSLTSRYGRFSAQPFTLGFGKLIGDALRQALLSGIAGPAITAVKIEGAEHQFPSVPGVFEDATEIILNLQKIPFKLIHGPKTLKIFKEGPGEVTAADIEADLDVQILDPTMHIANINNGGSLRIEMRLKRGRGYVSAGQNLEEDLESGYIPIDSIHAPVKKVNYTVEPSRVDQKQYDKLSIEIWTDGSVRPEDALGSAANLIMSHLATFINREEDRVRIAQRTFGESMWTPYYDQPVPDYGCQTEHLRFEREEISDILRDKLSSTEDFLPTIREVIQEESTARNYVTKRYRELIDRKYLTGLSETENEELYALTLTLEEMDKPYYEAIVDRLRNLIEQR